MHLLNKIMLGNLKKKSLNHYDNILFIITYSVLFKINMPYIYVKLSYFVFNNSKHVIIANNKF